MSSKLAASPRDTVFELLRRSSAAVRLLLAGIILDAGASVQLKCPAAGGPDVIASGARNSGQQCNCDAEGGLTVGLHGQLLMKKLTNRTRTVCRRAACASIKLGAELERPGT